MLKLSPTHRLGEVGTSFIASARLGEAERAEEWCDGAACGAGWKGVTGGEDAEAVGQAIERIGVEVNGSAEVDLCGGGGDGDEPGEGMSKL